LQVLEEDGLWPNNFVDKFCTVTGRLKAFKMI